MVVPEPSRSGRGRAAEPSCRPCRPRRVADGRRGSSPGCTPRWSWADPPRPSDPAASRRPRPRSCWSRAGRRAAFGASRAPFDRLLGSASFAVESSSTRSSSLGISSDPMREVSSAGSSRSPFRQTTPVHVRAAATTSSSTRSPHAAEFANGVEVANQGHPGIARLPVLLVESLGGPEPRHVDADEDRLQATARRADADVAPARGVLLGFRCSEKKLSLTSTPCGGKTLTWRRRPFTCRLALRMVAVEATTLGRTFSARRPRCRAHQSRSRRARPACRVGR